MTKTFDDLKAELLAAIDEYEAQGLAPILKRTRGYDDKMPQKEIPAISCSPSVWERRKACAQKADSVQDLYLAASYIRKAVAPVGEPGYPYQPQRAKKIAAIFSEAKLTYWLSDPKPTTHIDVLPHILEGTRVAYGVS